MIKKILFLILPLTLCSIQARSDIVGSNYFGRNLELVFMNISGWKNEFIFREKKSAFLPTFIELNDQFEFECVKGVDTSLSAKANTHADLFIRYCDKSYVEKKLKMMESNLKNFHSNNPLLAKLITLSKISHSQNNVSGKLFDTYQFQVFGIGHGIGVAYFTVTTTSQSNLAVISWIVFANDEKNCLADIMCKFDGEMMKEFNQIALRNEEKFLTPHLNEFKSHLAYPIVEAQWKQMGRLREQVKESHAFEHASKKYPEIDSDRAFQVSDFAGKLNKQTDGSYRMYLIMLIELADDKLSKDAVKDARSLILFNFDSYLTKYLASIVEDNG